MKILHTDKEETPATELTPEIFLQTIQQQPAPKPIDIGTGQPVPETLPEKKKNNAAIWAVVIIVLLLIVAGLVYYFKLKAQKENANVS